MATDWRTTYLSSLQTRDLHEQASRALYDRITTLSDRNASLQADLRRASAAVATTTTEKPAIVPPVPALVSYTFRRPPASPPPAASGDSSTALAQLRTDFSRAQQDRSELRTQLAALRAEHDAVRARAARDEKKLAQGAVGQRQMVARLRDREEELRGKAKLLTDVQDENATLNLQLNIAEGEIERLKKENQDLVDRWMRRVGREAEDMNKEAGFG